MAHTSGSLSGQGGGEYGDLLDAVYAEVRARLLNEGAPEPDAERDLLLHRAGDALAAVLTYDSHT